MAIELSVVSTLYQSAKTVDEFYSRTVSSCEKVTNQFEIILVNDGCTDETLIKATELVEKDNRVKIIDLSRNFGHHKAIMSGLSYSSGDYVFLIDSDLEEPPELLADFKYYLDQHTTLDMVFGVQGIRKGGLFERWSGIIYYKLINALVDVPIPKNFLTLRLMTRRYVTELCRYQERDLNFATLISLNGFDVHAMEIKKEYRGETSYTVRKKLGIMINTVTSSSSKPLWLIFIFGVIVTVVAVVAVLFVLLRYLFFGMGVAAWTSLMISIWAIGGILILSVGVVGIYLSKVFIEVKQRPYVNIRKIIERSANDSK